MPSIGVDDDVLRRPNLMQRLRFPCSSCEGHLPHAFFSPLLGPFVLHPFPFFCLAPFPVVLVRKRRVVPFDVSPALLPSLQLGPSAASFLGLLLEEAVLNFLFCLFVRKSLTSWSVLSHFFADMKMSIAELKPTTLTWGVRFLCRSLLEHADCPDKP